MQGLRNAFLQHQPNHPNTPATSKKPPLPENETTLITNDLATKTQVTTRNKPENPATKEPTPPLRTPSLPLPDSLSTSPSTPPVPPNDNLIRQGQVFSRPVYITPTWPFREEPTGNQYRY